MTRAAMYLRISSDPSGRALGVERQRVDCQELIERNGWELVAEFTDNDTSATRSTPRPGYEALLAGMESGDVQAVAVYSLDRLHRRPVELEHFIALADRRGVRLASVAGEVDLATGPGVTHARIMGAIAAQEARSISERVSRKQQELREQGKPWGGGKRPYGYDKTRMRIVDVEAATIRDCARRVLAGESLGSISRYLNARAVPTVTGVPWNRTTLRSVLGRPRLAGLAVHKGEIIGAGAWPAILSRDEFERVKGALDERRPENRARSRERKYLLSGIAICGTCGTRLQSGFQRTSGRSEWVPNYKCKSGAGHVTRRQTRLDAHVVTAFLDHLDDLAQQAVAYGVDHGIGPEIERLQQRLRDLAGLYAADGLTGEQLQIASTTLRARIADLERQRPSSIVTPMPTLSRDRDEAVAEWDGLTLAQRRFLLVQHLDRLVVHPSKMRGPWFDPAAIEIVWKP